MTSLLNQFADNLLPILLIVLVGYLFQKKLHIAARPLSQVIFYVFAPALIFKLLITTPIQAVQMAQMALFAASSMAAVGLLSWTIGKLLSLPAGLLSALLLTTIFANAGNYGLSLNTFALGNEAAAWASVFFITSALVANSFGIYIAAAGSMRPANALLALLRVPVVYAIPLALTLRATTTTLPDAISRPIDLLSAAAIPSMLIFLGMQIARYGMPKINRRLLAIALTLRLIVSPFIAIRLAPLFGLQGISMQAGILEAAMPTAVLTSIIAIEYNVEPEFVTGVILVTTVLSPLTLTPILAILHV